LSERFDDCLSLSHIILLSANFPEQILYLLAFFSRSGLVNLKGLAASLLDFPSFFELLEEFDHSFSSSLLSRINRFTRFWMADCSFVCGDGWESSQSCS
jgi:hypothetical protein